MPKSSKPTWVVKPPQPGQIQLHVGLGEGAVLTPEVKEALNRLSRELAQQDAQGVQMACGLTCIPGVCVDHDGGGCPTLVTDCPDKHCSPIYCQSLSGCDGLA